MKIRAQEVLEEDFGLEEFDEGGETDESVSTAELNTDVVVEWFKENPNPDDEKVHGWAESMGWEHSDLEEVIYGLVTEYVKMMDEE